MATMIPDDIQDFTTTGEGIFYRFLQRFAKPDDKYIAWYQPDISGREPDFILFSQDAGLIIFEVKDWGLDQIVSADPQFFILYHAGKEISLKNPIRQIREYFGEILDKIKKDGQLVAKDAHSYDQVKVTVNGGIVFPNINKHEYEQKGLHRIIPSERIFFWDDLHPQSPICEDPTGRCFQDALERLIVVKPRYSLTGRELNHLRQLIFPVVRIELPDRDAQKRRADSTRRLMLLDHNQESIARQYSAGHRIIIGPSGSGKSLILVHRAGLLRHYNPAIRNILFVCYNITLVNYIRRLLADKHVPLGKDGVEVCHFFQLCAKITGEDIPYEKADSEYYEMVIQDTLEKLSACDFRYDAILIDEGQDFSDVMLKVVTALLNPKTDHLAIALDENQNIYERRSSWKAVGIHARGRVHRLLWIYRNTKEIADFARRIIEGDQESHLEGHQAELFPEIFEATHGPMPAIRSFSDYDAIAAWVASQIRMLANEEGYPLSEIAVIYTMRSPEHDTAMHLPRLVIKTLEGKGILHNWISEDYRAKRSYDVTTDNITLSTIHSLKGLDYACVFVLGLDWLGPGNRWSEEQIRKLAYVAVTRAREKLFIPYCTENDLIKSMRY
ncbi:MAG TPA: 3'-5' exonuclease [Smithellaceae bacterium]|jgi:energy-coupling factor transporter ATP-binding protein EcfA2|nr:3'-5' exonuclease [Smithellaceae bacterium]